MNHKDYILGFLCCFMIVIASAYSYNAFVLLSESPDIIVFDHLPDNYKYTKVRVMGAIKSPGTYALSDYSYRLIDTIALAKGLSKDANIYNINPAQDITNAELISIPFSFQENVTVIKRQVKKKKRAYKKHKLASTLKNKKKSKKKKNKTKKSKKYSKKKLPSIKIKINTASKADLMLLPGVGDKLANTIIAHRNIYKLHSPDDLLEVKGIGKKKLEKMIQYIEF
ncbi:MAG: helix-hairpin-helix domain-containing protein [Cyanobacteriota bacterium]